MKTKHFLRTTTSLLLVLFIQSCDTATNESAKDQLAYEESPIESPIVRGKYLIDIMGCNDCHSPKKMGANGPEIIPELLLSGYPASRPIVAFDSKLIKEGFAMFYPDLTAAAGPWGITFAGNLTPADTGIGNWTEEQFKKALTQGKYKGLENTRTLLPPMPWMNFVEMKDEDVHAIFTYLKSINPIENIVPQPIGPDKM